MTELKGGEQVPYAVGTQWLGKRQRTEIIEATIARFSGMLKQKPFNRLFPHLLRYLGTFMRTNDILRLITLLKEEDAKTLMMMTQEQQVYGPEDAALFEDAAQLQKRIADSKAVLEHLTLNKIWQTPGTTNWNDWMGRCPKLTHLRWVGNANERRVFERIGALSLGMDRWFSLELDFTATSEPFVSEAIRKGFLLDRNIGPRPLQQLMMLWKAPMDTELGERLLKTFTKLRSLELDVVWTPGMLALAPPDLHTLILLTTDPRDWPDVKQAASLVQRPGWKKLTLAQGHLELSVFRPATTDLFSLHLIKLDSWDEEDEDALPGMELSPSALLAWMTDLVPAWQTIDVRVRRFYPVVQLAQAIVASDSLSVGNVLFRRDEILNPDDEWDDTTTPWFDKDDVRHLVRAMATKRLLKLTIDNAEENTDGTWRWLMLQYDIFEMENLAWRTVGPWLELMAPQRIHHVYTTSIQWLPEDTLAWAEILTRRKDPLSKLQFDQSFGLDYKTPHLETKVVLPTIDLLQAIASPSTLDTLHLQAIPVDPDAFLQLATTRFPRLRNVRFMTSTSVQRDQMLGFSPELTHLSWTGRIDDKTPLMDAETLLAIASRYPNLELLELDVRPSALTNDIGLWRELRRRLPRLKSLVLFLASRGFSLDEAHVFDRMGLLVRVDPNGPAPDHFRHVSPLDMEDDTVEDHFCALGNTKGQSYWNTQFLRGRCTTVSEDEKKLVWPDMKIADDDGKGSNRTQLEKWQDYRNYLSSHFPFRNGKRFRLSALSSDNCAFLDDTEKKTLEWCDIDGANSHTRMATLLSKRDGSYTYLESWPHTWFRGNGRSFRTEHLYEYRALYLTLRLLNPEANPVRIGQAIDRPNVEFQQLDQFLKFYSAGPRPLRRPVAHSGPSGPSDTLPPSGTLPMALSRSTPSAQATGLPSGTSATSLPSGTLATGLRSGRQYEALLQRAEEGPLILHLRPRPHRLTLSSVQLDVGKRRTTVLWKDGSDSRKKTIVRRALEEALRIPVVTATATA